MKPGEVDWSLMGPRVEADLKTCQEKFETLSARDQQEFTRFKNMVEQGHKLNFRNIISLRRIATGMGAL